jgi:hypothetical protein
MILLLKSIKINLFLNLSPKKGDNILKKGRRRT